MVVPFNISCGSCWMCTRGLYAQCETTQVREQGKGAALFGYTSLYGAVPGGQAEYLRVPQAHFGPIKVPDAHTDERWLYLSDILPTAWQAVAYADVPERRHARRPRAGPGRPVLRPDRPAPGRRAGHRRRPGARAPRHGRARTASRCSTWTRSTTSRRPLIELTGGRGPDAVIDAVGMEAHGSPRGKAAQAAGRACCRTRWPSRSIDKFAIDRLDALHAAVKAVRRGGTVSVSGVYGGEIDPMPMMEMFDRGIQLRMGQCHVKRWIDDIMPLVLRRRRPARRRDLATHLLPLEEAAHGYEIFQKKEDGCVKVVLQP